jgi:hypothetical protein
MFAGEGHAPTSVIAMGEKDGRSSDSNDEAGIGEVVRRRLFDDIGDERGRRRVAREYADGCFERSACLPEEWITAGSRDFLRGGFEACYPFTRRRFRYFSHVLSIFRMSAWAAGPLSVVLSTLSTSTFSCATTAMPGANDVSPRRRH